MMRCFCQLSDLLGAADELRATRRHLHANPERSFDEVATSELLVSRLADWGYEVARNVGGHGVVGTLSVGVESGAGTRSVAIRADMDVLPILEENAFDAA
ncbi:MAG TPA: hypothetical protein PK177_07175 [Burkholderiaceae bacterium]|nr:hypothetical protein [Burkholderiaceae bacterium]